MRCNSNNDLQSNAYNLQYFRSWNSDGSHTAIGFASFMSGPNATPKKPHMGIKNYNAIKGLTKVEGELIM